MDKSLIEYARTLTKDDGKSLSERALKMSQKAGQVAGAILAFEHTAAHRHQVSPSSTILEKVADQILVCLSIVETLGYSDHELDETLRQQLDQWGALLKAEKGIEGKKLPYEIHITVKDADVESFRADCSEIGVKPLLLDLHLKDGGVMKDLQTSSVHMGDNGTVMREVRRISDALKKRGYDVIREKVETPPWHPAAPSRANKFSEMPKNCYFECHFGVQMSDAQRPLLEQIAQETGCKLSRNAFKHTSADNYVQMMTHRNYDTYSEDFTAAVNAIKDRLEKENFAVDRVIIEFSLFDTRVHHDHAWITPDKAQGVVRG